MISKALDSNPIKKGFGMVELSDKKAVRNLILYRSVVDTAHESSSGRVFKQITDSICVNEELICLYASLDNILDRVSISDKDSRFISMIFNGNSVSDIIKYHGYPKNTAYDALNRIINKIVNEEIKMKDGVI